MSEATAALAGDNGAGAASGNEGDQEGGQAANDWLTGASEDTRAFIENKGWSDPNKVVESYHNLEKFAGGNKNLVELPGADADEEAMGKFFDSLGRPAKAEEYNLEMPDGGDAELDGWFRSTAHKHGLTDAQAKGLYDEWNGLMGSKTEAMMTALADQAEADLKGLQKELGQGYDGFIDAGSRAAKALGYDEAGLSQLEEKLGTADMMKLMAKIGEKIGEDSFEGSGESGGFGTTPAQAKAQISDLKLDKGFMDKYLKGDKDAIAKMSRLMEAAHA